MKEFSGKMQEQFDIMCKTGRLFVSSVPTDLLWDTYLKSFTKEEDPVFRNPEFTYHNCTLCSQFIKRYGNIVAINDKYELMSIFDVEIEGEYHNAAKMMSKLVKSYPVEGVFFETLANLNSMNYGVVKATDRTYRLGLAVNSKTYTIDEAALYGNVISGKVYTFNHFHINIPTVFVSKNGDSREKIVGDYRTDYEVFTRSMNEVSLDVYETVESLINQKALSDSQKELWKITSYVNLSKEYNDLSIDKKTNFCWVKSYGFNIARLFNELIGVLCKELASGDDINDVCLAWNKRVDPANYMNVTAPFTAQMRQDLVKTIEELGYEKSFNRRFAKLSDIKVNDIHHLNRVVKDKSKASTITLFDNLAVKEKSSSNKPQVFDGIQTMHIDEFLSKILPDTDKVELYLDNKYKANLCTLTTAEEPGTKSMFKYGNNFAMTTVDNLAGISRITETVKAKGGKIEGALRFSIMWADGNNDNSDLDAHCLEPKQGYRERNRIYFSEKRSSITGGNLDVDIQSPNGKLAVENIVHPNLKSMPDGEYELLVHNYADRSSRGFDAEICFDNETYHYSVKRPLYNKEFVSVAVVTLNKGQFTIKHNIQPDTSSYTGEIGGLKVNSFYKVNLVCLSPNQWDEDKPTGVKYHLFGIEDLKLETPIVPFNITDLSGDLVPYRKVLAPYSKSTMLSPTENHLACIAFNSEVRDYVILKVHGKFTSTLKITF